ncbi:MAG: endolytic transglycosylase MltG [Proteobacteria bacterium]|nr:endolytic transglycosylase MltG [Pseudomonadota bacterium]
MSKRSFRTALAIIVGILVIAVVLIAVFVNRALAYPDERHAGTGKAIAIEIKPGTSFPTVAAMLADKGIIAKPTWFRMYAMWKGDTTNIKTGKYAIDDTKTPEEVLAILVAGVKEKTAKVTLPEGQNMLEYFEKIAAAQIADAKELEALARDRDFLQRHGIAGDSVEGFLFPDTYDFRVGEKPKVVLERLITHHQEVWNAAAKKHARDLAKLKDRLTWTDRDVLVLASIVEKEAVEPAERPRIAQVFVNRLAFSSFASHKLETDPTIRYGCMVPVQKSAACAAWDKGDRLHREQLDDADNPYNTYQHKGLPPGPISNPGRSSIEAAMTPDGSEYLYFVATSKNSRSHAFAKSYDEHKRNVDKYLHP